MKLIASSELYQPIRNRMMKEVQRQVKQLSLADEVRVSVWIPTADAIRAQVWVPIFNVLTVNETYS